MVFSHLPLYCHPLAQCLARCKGLISEEPLQEERGDVEDERRSPGAPGPREERTALTREGHRARDRPPEAEGGGRVWDRSKISKSSSEANPAIPTPQKGTGQGTESRGQARKALSEGTTQKE